MKITSNSWNNYIKRLSAINKKAGELMRAYIAKNGTADTDKLIDYAYMLATKYGEASAELACLMYDEIATLQGVKVPPATPAPTATYAETAIAVNGANLQGEAVIPNAIDRLVKMAGQDTTLQNARRDGAEWAWVPMGDTCAFCITLASRGWQRQSRRAIQGGHAQHIHANCDCAYTVRFNGQPELEGYDPEKYLDMYNSHSGSPEEKINAMRRANYAKNKDVINARKRELYAKANNKPPTNVLGQVIKFDERLNPNVRQIIERLAREYDTRLYEVTLGAKNAAGTVDVGGTMRLSARKNEVPIHEFAHSIAQLNTDKLKITDNSDFWKEIKKLQREYRKTVKDNPLMWISSYEHSSRNADEFLAEAFTHAKMVEWGMEVPKAYGNLEYSKKVLAIIDKYFKKKS